ncbi:MAG TPA: LysR family transcriptional regulator [Solirubrobacteraceae bacterium]|nr:LysR family transcriptional regulator [Solirubrobacteraceae bacterium]
MTFAQLRSFATVARMGSVSEAATALGVSEPAVSSAVSALRKDLGDELFVRVGGGIRLTAGGERLAAAAAEIVGLEDRLRREVREARGERGLLRLVVSPTVAEYVSAPLLDAFTRRQPTLEVAQEVAAGDDFAPMLLDRRADVALGPSPRPAAGVDAIPFLRFKLVVVAGPRHRLAAARDIGLDALRGERWLVGPGESELARLFAERSLPVPETGTFATEAGAQGAAAAGEGVMLAIAHTVLGPLRRGSLVRLDVRGTPRDAFWYVATLGRERRSPVAAALRRFVATPEATQAIVARPGGVPAGRFRPPVYVTIWSALDVSARQAS